MALPGAVNKRLAARHSFSLWKQDFRLPGKTGAVAEGRLIYIVFPEHRIVQWLFVYTHSEYRNQPKNDTLERRIRLATQEVVPGAD